MKNLTSAIIYIALALTTSNQTPCLGAYQYDPNDFAVDVQKYLAGSGIGNDCISGDPFNNPQNALGRPTVDTTGDGIGAAPWEPMVVVPFYPAFRHYELVTIGKGGQLVLKFSHPVRDDKNNAYGVDFIVFGNTFTVMDGTSYWYSTSDPRSVYASAGYGFVEPSQVSVSQDGMTWYPYDEDPYADGYAPTLGRVYVTDPNEADPNAFDDNQFWGHPTDPTLPLDPNTSFADHTGKTLAQICQSLYGQSAGGTGFDLAQLPDLPVDPSTGLKWMQYVKIQDLDNGVTSEIDAVSDVTCCGDWKHPFPVGDLNGDCCVDLYDLAILSDHWLECTWWENCQ